MIFYLLFFVHITAMYAFVLINERNNKLSIEDKVILVLMKSPAILHNDYHLKSLKILETFLQLENNINNQEKSLSE